jgi:DNA processing protein
MEPSERAAQWVLWSIQGIGPQTLTHVVEQGGAARLWNLGGRERAELLDAAPAGTSATRRVEHQIQNGASPEALYRTELERLPEGGRIVHREDPAYPARLEALDDPPVFLYVVGPQGFWEADKTLAVVGSRSVGVDDVRKTRTIVSTLAEAGLLIVSGGALGVDAAAHEASLKAGRPTISVLPGGVDHPTPRRNASTFKKIAQAGWLVSEYPLGTTARPHHFPRRNRLIAALGDATFVVRGDLDSGTLLTATASRAIDRPLCALAGGLDETLAAGCLQLIVEGAQAVRGPHDILAWMDVPAESARQGASAMEVSSLPDGLSEAARRLAEQCRSVAEDEEEESVRVDAIRDRYDWTAAALQSTFLELELHGVVEKIPGALAYHVDTRAGGV